VLIKLIVGLPLLGSLLVGLTCRIISRRLACFITCTCLVLSAYFSLTLYQEVMIYKLVYNELIFNWMNLGNLKVNWFLKVDTVSVNMIMLVTFVSALVHIYSVGYMAHDPHIQRFMCYISYFTFCMLLLVTADNFVQLFFGWEGVGLCSYLLIAFWFKERKPNIMAIKSFIMNRVADFAFLIGIVMIYIAYGSVNYDVVFHAVLNDPGRTILLWGQEFSLINIVCGLLLIGAMGKSAQFLLHTWLPDAMEAPTPVSALIHAATMVTAGVFLIIRCSPMFYHAKLVSEVITIIGAISAIFAACIAITQTDIKKIIAYSTFSQLGYMFLACGVTAYDAALFHLLSHGCFKGLLFLGAGSVITMMDHQQDINKMGGIWSKMPYTYIAMWIGGLALAGIFPFSGYYSKDMLLHMTYGSGEPYSHFAFWVGSITAGLTGLYIFRLIVKVFHGTPKAPREVMLALKEAPQSILLALVMLSFCSTFLGIIMVYDLGIFNITPDFFRGAIYMPDRVKMIENMNHLPFLENYITLIFASIGIIIAFIFYQFRSSWAHVVATRFPTLYKLSLNKFYFDEIYEFLFVKPLLPISNFIYRIVDRGIIDNFGPEGARALSEEGFEQVSKLQTGYISHYAFIVLCGILIISTWIIIKSII